MAKKVDNTLAIKVPASSVVWFREFNEARLTRDYGKVEELKNSFILHGWKLDDNGIIKVEEIKPDLQERAMKERMEQWDALKSAAKLGSEKLVDLVTFEELYTHGGKLKPIEYLGVSANRRSEVFFPAMVERKKQNLPISMEIPVMVRHYANAAERLDDQIDENELKTAGFLEMSDVDRLLAAQRRVQLGAIQSDLRRVFKDGMGQKLWGLLELNRLWPTIGIVSRCQLPPTDKSYIRLAAVKFKDLPTLVQRSDPAELEKKNKQLRTAGKAPLLPATEEEIREYFATVEDNTGNAQKVMKGENIRGLVTRCPAKPLAAMAQAIAENNEDLIKTYIVCDVSLNCVDEIIKAGDEPALQPLLVHIVATKDRQALLKELVLHCEKFRKGE